MVKNKYLESDSIRVQMFQKVIDATKYNEFTVAENKEIDMN